MDLNLVATPWSLINQGLNLITEMVALAGTDAVALAGTGVVASVGEEGVTEVVVATVVAVDVMVAVEAVMVGEDVEGVTEAVVDGSRLSRVLAQLVQVNHWFGCTANYLDSHCFRHLICILHQ
jgi:hypothetical protein